MFFPARVWCEMNVEEGGLGDQEEYLGLKLVLLDLHFDFLVWAVCKL